MIRKLFSKLWADDNGFVISTELLFVTVILVIGVIAGLAALRNSVISEMEVVGGAIDQLSPAYTVAGVVAISTTGDGTTGSGAKYTPPTTPVVTATPGVATDVTFDPSLVP